MTNFHPQLQIGQAVRMAMTFGLHRDRPVQDWDHRLSERCLKVWWTVYILDRAFTSSMGVPISFQDNDITTPMPPTRGPGENTAVYLHVRLSALMSQAVTSQ